MTAAGTVPYRLRPNKAVDRELFLSLLSRLAPSLDIAKYHYIGLGGPFLEDFRLIHARLGIRHMTCVEADPEVYKRQLFNRPIHSVECVYATLEGFLAENYLDDPVVIWFDFTAPGNLVGQINSFCSALGAAPTPSVFRVTLNANPGSLGHPPAGDVSAELDGFSTGDRATKPTVQEWRLQRFKERLGDLFPIDLEPWHAAEGLRYERAEGPQPGCGEGAQFAGQGIRLGTCYALRRRAANGDCHTRHVPEGRDRHSTPCPGVGVLVDSRRPVAIRPSSPVHA